MRQKKRIKFFSSFEDENKAEYERRSNLSKEARIHEFSTIQKRAWGKNWTLNPIKKTATFEWISW